MDSGRNRWRSAGLYIGAVVLVNVGFSLSPQLDWLWSLVVGGVLVLRDVTQRSWGHRTLLLMLVAAAISYRLASPQLALASATAFLVSETIDWSVYTLTHRPFARRFFGRSTGQLAGCASPCRHLAGAFRRCGYAALL